VKPKVLPKAAPPSPKARKAKIEPKLVRKPKAPEVGLKAQLRRAEVELSGRERETGVVFNAQGQEVLRKTGSADGVTYSYREIEKMRGTTLIHNHPAYRSSKIPGAILEDLPLSSDDGAFLVGNRLSEIQAVTKRYRFVLRPKAGAEVARPTTIRRVFKAAENRRHRKQVAEVVKDHTAGKISNKKAVRLVFEGQQEVQHRAWLDVADDLGLEYRRIARGN